MKQTNSTVYLRKESRIVLKNLSERTRLSQSEILSEILKPLSKVLESFPECDRVTFGVYEDLTKKPNRVMVFLNPVLSGEFNLELSSNEKINELMTDCEIIKDLARKRSKLEKCGLKNCGMHSHKETD